MERYTEGPGAYLSQALEEFDALGVVTAILGGSVRGTTRPGHPRGRLGVQGALATGDSRAAAFGAEVFDLAHRHPATGVQTREGELDYECLRAASESYPRRSSVASCGASSHSRVVRLTP